MALLALWLLVIILLVSAAVVEEATVAGASCEEEEEGARSCDGAEVEVDAAVAVCDDRVAAPGR